MMYLPVISVTPIDNYKILLTFGNGEKRQFDMNPIEWENEADIDPEILNQNSEKVEELVSIKNDRLGFYPSGH